MKSVFFLMLLITNIAWAGNSFDAAKQAAASLNNSPVTTKPNSSKKEEPVPVPANHENLDSLICPEIGPRFIKTSNVTFRSMDDLLSALREERKQYSDFFLTLLQLDKKKPDDEVAASQMVDLKKGVDQKLKRAKENYNGQIKDLATSLPKSKKCWSYHDQKIKPDIGRLIEIFTKEPVLTEFKDCVKLITENNKVYEQRFTLSLNYYNKATSQGTTILEAKKNSDLIKINDAKEFKVCKNFAPGAIYSEYLNNKYEKKHNNETKVDKTQDLTKPLTLPKSVGPFGF